MDAAPAPSSKRPRAKEGAILAAAWRLFLDQGFGGTSMDAIAQAAGVSKATLYAYFSSKDSLFARIVADEGQRHSSALTHDAGGPAIGVVLEQAAIDFSLLLLSSDNMSVMRMIVSEVSNLPGLGAQFFAAGPAVLLQRLADCMEAAMQRGEMMRAPPRLAAGQFIGLILGDLHLRELLRAGEPTPRARRTVAMAGAAAFMRAYAIAPPPRRPSASAAMATTFSGP